MKSLIESLEIQLEEAKAEADELEECGDLEERLEALMHVTDLEKELKRARLDEYQDNSEPLGTFADEEDQ